MLIKAKKSLVFTLLCGIFIFQTSQIFAQSKKSNKNQETEVYIKYVHPREYIFDLTDAHSKVSLKYDSKSHKAYCNVDFTHLIKEQMPRKGDKLTFVYEGSSSADFKNITATVYDLTKGANIGNEKPENFAFKTVKKETFKKEFSVVLKEHAEKSVTLRLIASFDETERKIPATINLSFKRVRESTNIKKEMDEEKKALKKGIKIVKVKSDFSEKPTQPEETITQVETTPPVVAEIPEVEEEASTEDEIAIENNKVELKNPEIAMEDNEDITASTEKLPESTEVDNEIAMIEVDDTTSEDDLENENQIPNSEDSISPEEDSISPEEDSISPEEDSISQEENEILITEEMLSTDDENLIAKEENASSQNEHLVTQEDTSKQSEILINQDEITPQNEILISQEEISLTEEELIISEEEIAPESEILITEDFSLLEEEILSNNELLSQEDKNSNQVDKISPQEEEILPYEDDEVALVDEQFSLLEDDFESQEENPSSQIENHPAQEETEESPIETQPTQTSSPSTQIPKVSKYKKEYLHDYAVNEEFELEEETPVVKIIENPNKQDKNGKTMLMDAVKKGDKNLIQVLFNSGADVSLQDKEGWTALMYAARYQKDVTCLDIILEATPNVKSKNKYGLSALVFAATYNPNPQILERLLQFYSPSDKEVLKAFVLLLSECNDTENTLFSKAKIFVEYNIPLNSFYNGKTPLMYAAKCSDSTKIINLLLENNALVTIRSTEGKTAFDYAKGNSKLPHDSVYWSLNKK